MQRYIDAYKPYLAMVKQVSGVLPRGGGGEQANKRPLLPAAPVHARVLHAAADGGGGGDGGGAAPAGSGLPAGGGLPAGQPAHQPAKAVSGPVRVQASGGEAQQV